MFKLPRNLIAAFIPSERGIRAYEQMQDAVEAGMGSLSGAETAPAPSAIVADLEQRIAQLESMLFPSVEPVSQVDPLNPVTELLARLEAVEQAMSLGPAPVHIETASDGTYASPTSIAIASGLITAIS